MGAIPSWMRKMGSGRIHWAVACGCDQLQAFLSESVRSVRWGWGAVRGSSCPSVALAVGQSRAIPKVN